MSETAQKETIDQALARALNAAKLRRINEALGICRDLLVTQPDLPGALGLMGGILGQEGRVDEAINLLKAALNKQPNIGNWHLNLCALYRGKNMLDEALASGLLAIEYSPDSAAHRVELAFDPSFPRRARSGFVAVPAKRWRESRKTLPPTWAWANCCSPSANTAPAGSSISGATSWNRPRAPCRK